MVCVSILTSELMKRCQHSLMNQQITRGQRTNTKEEKQSKLSSETFPATRTGDELEEPDKEMN